jgi:hypothetical protein
MLVIEQVWNRASRTFKIEIEQSSNRGVAGLFVLLLVGSSSSLESPSKKESLLVQK